MARRKPISVRLSQEFEALLAGVSDNQSAIIRAPVLIGAEEAGLDLSVVQPDLLNALAHNFPEPIYSRLRDLYEQLRTSGYQERVREVSKLQRVQGAVMTGAVHETTNSKFAPPSEPDIEAFDASDPLASVGFDFEA